jgi:hypothetical protein
MRHISNGEIITFFILSKLIKNYGMLNYFNYQFYIFAVVIQYVNYAQN